MRVMVQFRSETTSLYKDSKPLQRFIKNISVIFENGDVILHNKRNVIKQFNVDPADNILKSIIVKRYKRPSFIQRIIYSFFRRSKSRRAFDNATELRKRGINTPYEIAYIEEWENGLFKYGYYLSASDFAPPIRERLIVQDDFDKLMAQDFAIFAAQLHEKGILHHDLNSTNVLYRQPSNGHYCFSVIDINRVNFLRSEKQISRKDCFENLTRFTGRMDLFIYVLEYYIRIRKWDKTALQEATDIKIRHDERWRKRKAFFRKLKPQKKK